MRDSRTGRHTVGATTIVVVIALHLLISCTKESKEPKTLTPDQVQGTLIRQLIMMADQQQRDRELLDSLIDEKGWGAPETREASQVSNHHDSVNMVRLEEIIALHGWPGKSLVGDQAALAAFLVLQHAELEIQLKYLPLVEAAAAKGDVERAHLAMLQDRVFMRQDKPQKYGTQLWSDPSTGKLGLYPIDDSINVDFRRAEVGLAPLADYIRSMGIEPESLSQRSKTTVIFNLGGDTAK
ncbi:MAG: DUF6624 domain-containing protein [Candidatus Zixiibacteriota bacterium]